MKSIIDFLSSSTFKMNTCLCPYLLRIFKEDLVVLAEGNKVNNGGYGLKTMDPLPPLRALATHIHHPVSKDP